MKIYINIGGAYYEKKEYNTVSDMFTKEKNIEKTLGNNHPKTKSDISLLKVVDDAVESTSVTSNSSCIRYTKDLI